MTQDEAMTPVDTSAEADQRRLLYLASTASMNWGHRDRAGYTLDPLQFESARDVIHPDDFRKAIDAEMTGECPTCHGRGLVTIRGMCGGVEMDCDNQPCPDCADIREAARGPLPEAGREP